MSEQNRTACLSLNADYYIDASAQPDALLDDANLLLGYAQGMTRALGDALIEGEALVHSDLADALQGIASLISMGMRCADYAHRQFTDKVKTIH